MIKKFSILFVFFTCFFVLGDVYAKESTLNELEAQAKANREAYNKAKNQKALTESERDAATSQKAQVESEIKNINSQIDAANKEIDKIQKSIEVKNEEIKDLMKFVQVSNGESAYLEYAFGASSFTDFIYRVSVAEQLSSYNEDLIKDYNKSVKELEQKQKDLSVKQVELSQKQQELSVLEAKLNKEIETLQSGIVSKDDEYKTQVALINSMKQRGCSGSDTLSSCQSKIRSSSNLVSTNGTYLPISSGYVTSDYGGRTINGSYEFHTGVDFSRSVAGDTVYPIADGEVVLLTNNPTCGNHIVYVKHNIGGHSYVTSYWHLSSWSVRVGQKVSYTTPIGAMAGRNSTDSCSGGIHVHLNLFDNANDSWERNAANGSPNKGRINPRTVVTHIPSHMQYFSHR